jgi:glycosyltransferase involved in cell wall biosynthesis
VSAPSVSIVLPVWNQAEHIGAIVPDYLAALRRTPYAIEMVLVVNNCRDRSLEVCRDLARRHSEVRVIESAEGGWGRAVRLGLAAAQGELLCYSNSARTDARDLVLLVVYAASNPGAVVKAHRRSRESFPRKLGSFLYNLQVRALFDLPTWDINATPKVFPRTLYEALDLRTNGDLIDLEIYLKCRRLDQAVLEVPIYRWTRHGDRSTTNLRSAARIYAGATRIWWALRKGRDLAQAIERG